jgi:hypothetical protein
LVFLGLTITVALGVGVWFLWPAQFPIRAYERVRLGMTRDQVEAIMQKAPTQELYYPTGDELWPRPVFITSDGRVIREIGYPARWVVGVGTEEQLAGFEKARLDDWMFGDYEIWVTYDSAERAVGCDVIDFPVIVAPTFLDRIRTWLGL